MELEEVRLRRLMVNIDLSYCAKLSLASVEYMVANATNTAAITITLHPEAYARLTDELIAAKQGLTYQDVTALRDPLAGLLDEKTQEDTEEGE